jgi:hypothetical protein
MGGKGPTSGTDWKAGGARDSAHAVVCSEVGGVLESQTSHRMHLQFLV